MRKTLFRKIAITVIIFLSISYVGLRFLIQERIDLTETRKELHSLLQKNKNFRISFENIHLNWFFNLSLLNVQIRSLNDSQDQPNEWSIAKINFKLKTTSLLRGQIELTSVDFYDAEVKFFVKSPEDIRTHFNSIIVELKRNIDPLQQKNPLLRFSLKRYNFIRGNIFLYIPVIQEKIANEENKEILSKEKYYYIHLHGLENKIKVFQAISRSKVPEKPESNLEIYSEFQIIRNKQKFLLSVDNRNDQPEKSNHTLGLLSLKGKISKHRTNLEIFIPWLQSNFFSAFFSLVNENRREGNISNRLSYSFLNEKFYNHFMSFHKDISHKGLLSAKFTLKTGLLSSFTSKPQLNLRKFESNNNLFLKQTQKASRSSLPSYIKFALEKKQKRNRVGNSDKQGKTNSLISLQGKIYFSDLDLGLRSDQVFLEKIDPVVNLLILRDHRFQLTESKIYFKNKPLFMFANLSENKTGKTTSVNARFNSYDQFFWIPPLTLSHWNQFLSKRLNIRLSGNINAYFHRKLNYPYTFDSKVAIDDLHMSFPSKVHHNKIIKVNLDELNFENNAKTLSLQSKGKLNQDTFNLSLQGQTAFTWFRYFKGNGGYPASQWTVTLGGEQISYSSILWLFEYIENYFKKKLQDSKDNFKILPFAITKIGKFSLSSRVDLKVNFKKLNFCGATFNPLELEVIQMPKRLFVTKFNMEGYGLKTDINAYINHNFESPYMSITLSLDNLDLNALNHDMQVQPCTPDFFTDHPITGKLSLYYQLSAYGVKLMQILRSEQKELELQIQDGVIPDHPFLEKIAQSSKNLHLKSALKNLKFKTLLYKESRKNQFTRVDQLMFDADGFRLDGSGYEKNRLGKLLFFQIRFSPPFSDKIFFRYYRSTGSFQNLRITEKE